MKRVHLVFAHLETVKLNNPLDEWGNLEWFFKNLVTRTCISGKKFYFKNLTKYATPSHEIWQLGRCKTKRQRRWSGQNFDLKPYYFPANRKKKSNPEKTSYKTMAFLVLLFCLPWKVRRLCSSLGSNSVII